METNQTINQNESIALKLSFYNENNKYNIGKGYYSVYDDDGNVVIAEQAAYDSDNLIVSLIGTTVTANIGNYYILWKIIDEDNYIYYHKTYLQVI